MNEDSKDVFGLRDELLKDLKEALDVERFQTRGFPCPHCGEWIGLK